MSIYVRAIVVIDLWLHFINFWFSQLEIEFSDSNKMSYILAFWMNERRIRHVEVAAVFRLGNLGNV